ncbi:MAG: glycosyltransferase family 4 protein [Longimicrobiales bacterium]
MTRPRRIVFVQHAGAPGGSAMSLLYTIAGLDPARFEPLVALARPTAALRSLYVDAGVETIDWPGLALWDHSTVAPRRLYRPRSWWKLGQVALRWRATARRTLELVRQSRADLVHLNSMPLAPSAAALTDAGFPYVWHVREPPLPAWGLRYAALRRIMLRADALIFISEADRRAWIGGHPAEVIHNFVDLERFHPDVSDDGVRARFGIAADQPLLLYLGGASAAKGVDPLLDALALLTRRVAGLRCLMPGIDGGDVMHNGDATRAPAVIRRLMQRIRRLDLQDVVVAAPFQSDIAPLIAASDVVVFPATRPHFARPAIEAAAMARPVVASRFPVMEELVRDGVTGCLVAPGDAEELAAALGSLLEHRPRRRALGNAGREFAEQHFDQSRQIAHIMDVYEGVLSR